MFERTFIGLDVHAVSVVGCALSPDTGELVQAKMDSDPAVVLEWIRRCEPPVKAVYESRATGQVPVPGRGLHRPRGRGVLEAAPRPW